MVINLQREKTCFGWLFWRSQEKTRQTHGARWQFWMAKASDKVVKPT